MTAITNPNPSVLSTRRSASLSSVTSVVWWGTFGWIGWLWLVVSFGYAVTLTASTIWGSPESSLWEPIAAGWWRWPIGGAGVSMAVALVPIVVNHGVTRRRAADAVGVVGLAVSVAAALILTVGFVIERVVFDANDFPWTSQEDVRLADTPFPLMALVYTVIHLAFFVSGWIIGAMWQRHGWTGLVAIPVAAIPVFVTELFTAHVAFGRTDWILKADDLPSLWVGIPLSIAVIAGGAAIAQRLTRRITLR